MTENENTPARHGEEDDLAYNRIPCDQPAGDLGAALIRTIVPAIVGVLMGAITSLNAAASLPFDSAAVEAGLTGVVTVVVTALYYLAGRALEGRGIHILGSKKTPTYSD